MFLTLVKPEKEQWTDPYILVPIITAVIASIVGPTYYFYFLSPKPNGEPSTPPATPRPSEEPSTPTPPPSNIDEIISEANTLYNEGHYDKAAEYYDKVLAIDPDNACGLEGRDKALNVRSGAIKC